MSLFASAFTYPLLARELTERAARPRTYIFRVAYGALLYGLFLATVQQAVARSQADADGMWAIGFGHDLLGSLMQLLCWSLLLIQPALMAGVITYEKERDSFPLLILTGMSPTKMLLEKYLAGLFPMATLLLLALPLGAITMGYGGVSVQLVAAAAVILLATWLAVGAWALFCSAWARSTLGALLLAYLGGGLLLLAGPLFYSLRYRYVLPGADLSGVELPAWLWAVWPPELYQRVATFQNAGSLLLEPNGWWSGVVWEAARQSAALFAAALVFLILARVVLLRRSAPAAHLTETRPVPRFVQQVSLWFFKLRPARRDLPTDDPVAWRESGRSVLGRRGRFLYLVFVLCALTLAFSVFLLGMYPKAAGPRRLHALAVVLGSIAVLVLCVRSVNALLSERANETLDIMATTPLGIGETIRQKARALGRYWLLFGCMLGIVFALQGWSEYEYVRANMFWVQLGQYWSTAALALVVYPPLLIWLSLLLAAGLRRRGRATFLVLGLCAAWLIGPLAALQQWDPLWREKPARLWLSLLSPVGILAANESDTLTRFAPVRIREGRSYTVVGVPWPPVVANYAFYALLAFGLRTICLRNCDRLLRR